MSFMDLLGPTAVATIICLIVAFVMFVIELFTPGIGVAGATGLLALIAVIVMFEPSADSIATATLLHFFAVDMICAPSG